MWQVPGSRIIYARKMRRKSPMSRGTRSSVPMKRTPKSDTATLLAFGAHPDDIEFGCGAVIAKETRAARKAHLVICSKGESATHGTPARRMREAKESAGILGSTVEFIQLDGDAHLESRVAHAITLAGIIRRIKPDIVL